MQRLAAIAVFTALMVLTARATIEIGAVPITLQVFAVLLSGLVLGARDGALVQIAYLTMIALNMPVDARAIGAAAFVGPTAGYLVAFVPAAWLAGFLVQHGAQRIWQRWLAGIAAIVVIYTIGTLALKVITGISWPEAWAAGVVPFLGLDLIKALVAAAMAEGGRAALRRWLPGEMRT
jgi:biotin transport system substrate-specific component